MLFVFDQPGAWTRYRCVHQGEQLRFLGVSYDIAQASRIDLAAAVDHYECFVLNRVQWCAAVAEFVERARSRGKLIVFDTDDLLFEPNLDRYFAFLDGEPEAERRAWIATLDRYRRTLEACHGAIVTTEPLREFALRRSDHVQVVFNAVSEDMLQLADEALARKRCHAREPTNDEVCIGYFSGTPTHSRDYLEAADAVLWALEEYPQTRLLIVGKLPLDVRFDRFGSRIRRIPKQPWQALPRILSRVDINLAPLERDNPFTDCKSCVKYLEAGLLGVPTIASPRTDFIRAIDADRNGLLADGGAEWRDALRRLIESPRLRVEIGEEAAKDVRANHTTKARVTCFAEALSSVVPAISES